MNYLHINLHADEIKWCGKDGNLWEWKTEVYEKSK